MQGACSSVKVTMPGRVILDLPDGTRYSTQYPQCEVEGLMSTQKILNWLGKIVLTDETNGFQLQVTFDAEKKKRSSGFFSMFSSSPRVTETGGLQNRKDLIIIEIFQLADESHSTNSARDSANDDDSSERTRARGPVLYSASGSYLEQIKYENDEEAIWSINHEIERMQWLEELEPGLVLPSDSSLRQDAHHILNEAWEEAEAAKHELEDK